MLSCIQFATSDTLLGLRAATASSVERDKPSWDTTFANCLGGQSTGLQQILESLRSTIEVEQQSPEWQSIHLPVVSDINILLGDLEDIGGHVIDVTETTVDQVRDGIDDFTTDPVGTVGDAVERGSDAAAEFEEDVRTYFGWC